MWRCFTPEGEALDLWHREHRHGPWATRQPDGSVQYDLPLDATDGFEFEPAKRVVLEGRHVEGCPKRGRYRKWVPQTRAIEIGEHHHVEGVAIWESPAGPYVMIWVEPHLETCTCQSGWPHWGHPRPPVGSIWRVVKEYTPDAREYAPSRLDKTRMPHDWPGRRDHSLPHGKNKRWKYEYTRRDKVFRARKLGMEYDVHRRKHWREWADID